MSTVGKAPTDQQIWVVFTGAPPSVLARMPWLRLFHARFRHCFVALRDSCGWLAIDPLSRRLIVARLAEDPLADVTGEMQNRGMEVLGPFRPAPPKPTKLPPFAPFTCVCLCLRMLGLAPGLTLTPYQLYRRLSVIAFTDDRNFPLHSRRGRNID
jgi:hypothetical protein